MSLIDQIKSAQAGDERVSVTVDRWKTTIYFRPVNSRSMNQITRRHPKFFTEPSLDGMVDYIVMFAENEDGAKVFQSEDKHVLLGEPVGIINDIVVKIMPANETTEDVEKN